MRPNKKVNKLIEKDLSNYVNIETGETLLSELACNNEKVKITKETDLVTISSKEFIIMDTEAWEYINTILNNVDRERILKMGHKVKTDFNIVFNNTYPYTEETLAEFLNLHIKKFRSFISRLVKHNILSYIVCAPSGYVQKVYILNPTLVRKRKTFNKDLLNIFKDLSIKSL